MFRLLSTLVLFFTFAFAQAPSDPDPGLAALKKKADSLNYQQGEITLGDNLAIVKVPESLRYLGPKDAEVVISDLWGNPRGERTLGMLVPADAGVIGPGAWGVIISFEEEGYVKDDDAAKIDYKDLLKEMKEDTQAGNKARTKAGYPGIELIGWAAPPRYDAQAKKLYWAKELKFGDIDENTLNYDVRVLGRRGVLVLSAVASMEQLAQIEKATPTILAAVDFNTGHRYADFNASSDKVATYGIAGLIAGGVLAKTGVLAKLGIIFAKFAKVIIIGAVALFAVVRKLFQRAA
jgi:uncharacterized membrane-anchored protein